MSINRQSFLAFTAEMSKLAFVGRMLHEGWHGPASAAQGTGLANPMFGKVMTVGMTAMQAPGAVKEEDPTGQGRSRTERIGDLAGQTVGGTVGMGAAGMATRKFGLQAGQGMQAAIHGGGGKMLAQGGKFLGRNVLQLGLPMGAAIAAGKIMAAPGRAIFGRKHRPQATDDQPSPNPGNGAAQTPIAQEGQQGQMR